MAYTEGMAGRVVQLVSGARYYAGVDLPWIVPRSVVTGAAEDMGFTDISWHARDEQSPPLNPATADPSYSNDWDEWATGIYRGQTRFETLSHAPAWIAMQPPPPTSTQPTQPPAPVAPPTPTPSQAATAQGVPARIQQIVQQALASGNADYIRETAAALKAGGWEVLGRELAKSAGNLLVRVAEAGKDPSNWPLFIALDVAFYGTMALIVKKKGRR